MIEAEFRGKRIDNGQWVEGYFFKDSAGLSYILTMYDHTSKAMEFYEVDPATVGQFMGLPDENGKKIFKGDIVQFCDCGEEGYEYKEGYDFANVAVVVWNNGRIELDKFADTNSSVVDDMNGCHEDFMLVFETAKIIGNIFDNPELLEGEEG